MATQDHNSSLLDLLPDTIIELYEIDLGEQDGVYRFHPGAITSEVLFFNSFPYYSLPVQASEFDKRADGQMPRPSLVLANVDGFITDVLKGRADLVGNTFIRKRVFLKFIDNSNFPNNFNPFGVPNSESRFDDEFYIINKKTTENKLFIEFELVSPLEFENVKLPARIMIANYCPWRYRGTGCKYGQLSDFNNQIIDNENVSVKTPSTVCTSGGVELGNLGLPVADENDKLFFEKEGYNIKALTWRGDYSKTVSDYIRGDVVRIKSKFQNLAKMNLSDSEQNLEDDPDTFFVCIQDSPADKDPRYEKVYWVQDQCSKKLTGCQNRFQLYGEYRKGLPFGGFPSIESYRFR